VAGEDGVRIVEQSTGLVRRHLTGHRAEVSSLAFTPDGRRLVTGSFDNTGLVWDVALASLAVPEKNPSKLWTDLGSAEANPANRALAGLAADPAAALALLKEKLRPAAAPDSVTLDRLVADLGSDNFRVRDKAFADLDRMGEAIVPELRQRTERAQTEESRRRITRLLEKHDPAAVGPDQLRRLRGLEFLEQLGTPEARQLLGTLAGGSPEARLTREAQDSVRRLAGRLSPP
jgi:hypothetical protein